MPLRLRDRIVELSRGLDPQPDGSLGVSQSRLVSLSVSHATRQLRHVRNKGVVLLAPVDDDLVLLHDLSRQAGISG